jgi:hypothetical protein
MPGRGGDETPPAREKKPQWSDVPASVREDISSALAERIVAAEPVWGGFGPSATFAITTGSGRRYFCKGAQPEQTAIGNSAIAHERRAFETFPELSQFAPSFHGAIDHDSWSMLLFDFAERRTEVPPWTHETFAAAITAIARFHKSMPARAPSLLEQAETLPFVGLFRLERSWATLQREPDDRERFLSLFRDKAIAGRWFDRNIERLIALEASAKNMGGPRSWIHQDIRSDNLIFSPSPLLVDWPFLAYGPVLSDIAGFLPSVAGEGGPEPAMGLRAYEDAAGMTFAQEDVAAAAALISGFFAARAGEPEIAQLPRLRWIQRLQLFPALEWVSSLIGGDAPGR